MKILQISASYKPAYIYGGPTMSVSMLSEQLIKAGFNINVFTTTANGANELDVQRDCPTRVDEVTVTYFNRITKDHSHFSPALLKAVWKNAGEYDVIHIHAWWNLVSVLSCLIAVWLKTPVLVSARGTLSPYSFQNKNKVIKLLIHYLISKPLLKSCHFHVTSNRENTAINKVISPKSITDIPNFVKFPACKTPISKTPASPLKLLFLSRIEEKKGLNILISALPLLTFPYTLTIAGDGNLNYINELKEMAQENGTEENITWAGFQNNEKFDLLREHDLLILPSHDENFGNVVIESLSQGTAVLLSKAVGLSGYVTGYNLGWDCELNAQAIGDKLSFINNAPDQLSHIRETAPIKIRADFDENFLVQQYMAMYNHIIRQSDHK